MGETKQKSLCVHVLNQRTHQMTTVSAEVLDIFHVANNGKDTAKIVFPGTGQAVAANRKAFHETWKVMLNTGQCGDWSTARTKLTALCANASEQGKRGLHGMLTFYDRRFWKTYASFMPARNLQSQSRSTTCTPPGVVTQAHPLCTTILRQKLFVKRFLPFFVQTVQTGYNHRPLKGRFRLTRQAKLQTRNGGISWGTAIR
jgi:hypothetical protein